MAMTPRFNFSASSNRPANSNRASGSRTIRIDPAVGSAPAPVVPEEPVVETETEHVAEAASRMVPVVESPVSRLHFIPETYEPNYSYPLIVWLTTPDQSFDLAATMDAVSDRNYLGMQVELGRVFTPSSEGEAFARQLHAHELTLHKTLRTAITKFRRDFKVHSERIYLAGIGQGGVAALHLGLSRPEWFGGVISIDAGTDRMPKLLRRFRHLQGERVLLAHSRGAAETKRTAEQKLSRMLYSAGLRVCRRAYATTEIRARRGSVDLYRDIDRWVMQDIAQAQLT